MCNHFRPISGWRVMAWEEDPFLSIASQAKRTRKACRSPDKYLCDFLPIRTNGWALGSLLWGQTCLLTGFGLSSLSSTDDSVPGSSYPLSMKLLPLLKHLSSALWEGHLQSGGPKTLSGVRSHGRGGVGCRPEGRWVSSWAAFGG